MKEQGKLCEKPSYRFGNNKAIYKAQGSNKKKKKKNKYLELAYILDFP